VIDRLSVLADRYEKLSELLCDPDVAGDPKRLREYSKEQSGLQEAYEAFTEYRSVSEQLDEAKVMLGEKLDDEMRDMVKLEVEELSERKAELDERIRVVLLPKDPNDEKNVIVEIRGAAGGDEAALFASDLYRMYTRYADSQGWRTEIMDMNESDLGGFKEVVFMIIGKGAYSKLNPCRYVLLERRGWPVRQHDQVGCSGNTRSNGYRRNMPRRQVAEREQS
jgi:peptide chain release factor 1